ncbi:MAG: YjjW family glycine radical enzyme activase [Velocimicrobium sp.]
MAINKIIPFSCVDGPGNRMVIFFQGCNFSCGYCHNPETIHHCINCGACAETCPVGALTMNDGKICWDDKKCVECDMCIKTCKYLSSPKTKDSTPDDIMKRIKRAEAFIDGITISGGECTLNIPFLTELFQKVKGETHLTCFIDTNGSIDLSNANEFVNLTDGFMLDVKAVMEEEHKKLTGMSNDVVLKNLEYLLEKQKLYEVRTVLAPGLQHELTVSYVANKIKDTCIYKLLRYRPFGVREEGIASFGTKVTTKEYMEDMIKLAKEHGASKVIGV